MRTDPAPECRSWSGTGLCHGKRQRLLMTGGSWGFAGKGSGKNGLAA